MLLLSRSVSIAEPETKERGRCRESGQPAIALQELLPLLNPCIARYLLLPLLLGKGIQVAVFILKAAALHSLMPSSVFEYFLQPTDYCEALAETFCLHAALSAYRVVWTELDGHGGKANEGEQF